MLDVRTVPGKSQSADSYKFSRSAALNFGPPARSLNISESVAPSVSAQNRKPLHYPLEGLVMLAPRRPYSAGGLFL